jgi:proteasome lid subunit RPN8/RPN11
MPSAESREAVLRVSPDIRRRLLEAAAHGRPAEVCGALLGEAADGEARVSDITPLPNRARTPASSYGLDPAELEPLLRSDRVIGFYHSHPDAPAEFSARDTATDWPGYWYVVVGRAADGGMELAAWRNGSVVRIEVFEEATCRR